VNILLVKLQGIDDRDAALIVKGKHIAVPREQLPKAGKGEYYWSDLIGLKVTNQQQADLGEIMDVFATGANDVMVVKQTESKQAEKERLLPFIDQVVLEVDTEAKTMLVDWPAEWDS
jgi:16S rRNA processing protein RimM